MAAQSIYLGGVEYVVIERRVPLTELQKAYYEAKQSQRVNAQCRRDAQRGHKLLNLPVGARFVCTNSLSWPKTEKFSVVDSYESSGKSRKVQSERTGNCIRMGINTYIKRIVKVLP